MSLIKDWSKTPADNELTIPFGAPITWYPSEVSTVVRQHMADHRTQWEDAEWFNWGHDATQTNATTFTIPTNVTTPYFVGRRIKIIETTPSTFYGTISTSVYTAPNTIVTVQLDSGALTSAMNGKNVSLSIITPQNRSFDTEAPGFIKLYAALVVPAGYLECNGQAVSRTTYARLFAVTGAQWGAGDGSTTFNVPDFRGMFIRGFDAGAGRDPGRVFAAFQDQSFLSHAHGLAWETNTYISPGIDTPIKYQGGPSGGHATLPTATNLSGGSETRPKNNTAFVLIKT